MMTSRLATVLSAIDHINLEDPNQIMWDGKTQAKELVYGHQMSACLDQYWPEANELLKIATRAQHIKRWQLKRTEFATGKAGYLQWRVAQGKFHAQLTKSIMLTNGYDEDEAEVTARILRKEQLRTNDNTQTLEDVACLVFLQYYFDDFASKHSQEKIIRILQLTWRKMSEQAQSIALSLTFPDHLASLVNKALSEV